MHILVYRGDYICFLDCSCVEVRVCVYICLTVVRYVDFLGGAYVGLTRTAYVGLSWGVNANLPGGDNVYIARVYLCWFFHRLLIYILREFFCIF